MTTKFAGAALHALETLAGHLHDRSAVLFLGAGINFGTKNRDGQSFPLAAELASRIASDVLNDPDSTLDLQDAADMARMKFGDTALNQFIYELFEKYLPSTAQIAVAQLPWNCVYTTNYDLLIERAAKHASESAQSEGEFKPIFSSETDISSLADSDIPYYKIHGSIDFANTAEGRLIITREDYRNYQENRATLFRRLRTDLLSKTFVFVGYGFKDDNLREVLDEVRHALGTQSLPASFAVRKNFSPSEADYWKDKYNVQLIDADASEFLIGLRDTWQAERKTSRPRTWSNPTTAHSETARFTFPHIGVSFYQLIPDACVGASNPGQFFTGGSYTWPDARDSIAPKRDQYWTILESLFADFTDPSLPPSIYLLTGPAGTGKTTLCRTVAFDVARDLGLPVLLYIPGTPLDARSIGAISDTENLKRILVLIQDGAMYADDIENFVADLKRLHLPVSILIEERKNEWAVASQRIGRRLHPIPFELGTVSEEEIEDIIDALTRFNCLGKLKGLEREHQRAHFGSVAHKELIVALREITSTSTFDEIIRDEFTSIPSDLAKKAYVYVAAIGQANVPLRYEHLIRLLGIRFDQLGTEILRPTDRVLIEGEEYGSSRHNSGFSLRARHPIIASVIFATAAPDDEARYQVLRDIVNLLDPGYREDRRLLEEIVRREQILGTIADPERKRAIFEIISRILPRNAFVLQHRSMLERLLNNPEGAAKFARQALDREEHNLSIKNTLGLALVAQARNVEDSLKRTAYLTQAKKIFEEGIQKDVTNPYSYVGMTHVLRAELEALSGPERVLAQTSILAMLEDAFETTSKSEIIAGQLAEQQRSIGAAEDALKLVVDALKSKEADTKLRVLEVRLRQDTDPKGALNAALVGLRFDPNSWKLNRLAARLLRRLKGADSSIRGHYEAARRQQKGDLHLGVEYAAFLFTHGYRPRAAEVFNELQQLPLPAGDKRLYREWWRVDEVSKRNRVFSGAVKSIRGATATLIATPENFEAMCWQSQLDESQLKVGENVSFVVAFNAFGAQARLHRGA